MENDAETNRKTSQERDALLDSAALMLLEELEGCHDMVRRKLAAGHTDTATRMMAASAALAGALARLKGETRQRIIVKRLDERPKDGSGAGSEKSKNE
jgi:hypothetical protein